MRAQEDSATATNYAVRVHTLMTRCTRGYLVEHSDTFRGRRIALVIEIGDMTSVFDILGLTHIAVTSVAQSIGALKSQLDAYKSLPSLLDSAEEKAKLIDKSIVSLKSLAKVSTLDSEFFSCTFSKIRDVQDELRAVHAEVGTNRSVARFLFASRIQQRLVDVNGRLSDIELSLSAVGMIAEIVLSLREGMDARFNELGAMLDRTLKSSNPTIAAESLLDSIRSSDTESVDESFSDTQLSGLLGSEKKGLIFLLLGRSHYEGDDEGRKDFFRAARYLHAAYAQGYTAAALYLGNLFYNGKGVQLNYRTAIGYYSVGAQSGDAAAMSRLGWMYAFGCGVEVNGRLAVKWSEKAAEKGDGLGLRMAGYYALHGNSTRQNTPKAVRYLKAALRAGEHIAGNQLGLCYLYGIGVERDVDRAFELLRKAYVSSDAEASTFTLASSYEEIEQNYVEAAKLYKEIAECGTELSRNYSCYYGRCLILGLGVNQDINEGIKIVRRSLKEGAGGGWFVLGEMYRYGHGVKRSISKAVRYFSKAVLCSAGMHGIMNSDKALAELYEAGDGFQQSLSKAAHHYIRAANRMDPESQWKAGTFFESGSGVDENIRRAFVFFDMSARGGHVQAQRKAGELYMRGKGVERDRSKAIRLLQEAADRGDARAAAELRRARRPHLLCWRRVKTE